MKVGVTGANGFVGSHLAAALAAAGHELHLLLRKTSRLQWLEGISFTQHYGDIRQLDGLDRFVDGLDILIHCAALTTGTRQELTDANTLGTARLLDSLKRVNPNIGRFILISSQEVAGINPHPEMALDEDSPTSPITDYGRSKLRAEELLKKASDWLKWTIIRPSPVYGPRDKDTFLFFQAASARLKPVAFFPGKISLLFVGNLAQGIIQAMNSSRTLGQVYLLADNPSFSWPALTRIIETATLPHRLILPLSRSFLFVVTAISSAWGLVSGQRVILNRQKYLMFTAPNLSVNTDKARRDFAYQEFTPTHEAMSLTYQWYLSAGWL